MADHRKTGMTPAELHDALGRHVVSVQRIQEMFPEDGTPPDLGARDAIRTAVAVLKTELIRDHKRGSALSGIEGTAITSRQSIKRSQRWRKSGAIPPRTTHGSRLFTMLNQS